MKKISTNKVKKNIVIQSTIKRIEPNLCLVTLFIASVKNRILTKKYKFVFFILSNQ